MKKFLTLTFAGFVLAGFALGTLIEGTDQPVRQGVLLGFGLWLTVVGVWTFADER